jgi:hypothetical protein
MDQEQLDTDVDMEMDDAEIQNALTILDQQKERRSKDKARRDSPEMRERQKQYNNRRRIKFELTAQKALAAGITVTDEEVEEVLKKRRPTHG